jgi:uncharacterized membrane protein
MDKEVPVIVLVVITILTVYIVVQPIIPVNNEKFSELGLLGPNQKIADYPELLTPTNNSFGLYAYIGNHQGTVEYYEILAKLGNVNTTISNTTSANLPVLYTFPYVLDDGQNVTFPIQITINQTGTNLRLIFELWDYDLSSSAFVYTGLYTQLWLNATS